jgi:hypothetical protein
MTRLNGCAAPGTSFRPAKSVLPTVIDRSGSTPSPQEICQGLAENFSEGSISLTLFL